MLRAVPPARAVTATLALMICLIGSGSAPAFARGKGHLPHITSVRCWPPGACGGRPHVAPPGGTLRLKGRNLRPRMLVLFPGRQKSRARARTAAPRLRRANGLQVTIPAWAKSGRIMVATRGGLRSNAAGPIRIRRRASAPHTAGVGPFDGSGMWIWYVSRSSGGDPAAIVAQARNQGVRTVFVKSSDGTTWWPQFSPGLVSALKAQGLRVCAWQFVYGDHPSGEAAVGARAASTGADCLVIDAESAYEGKYAQAQAYLKTLRSDVGSSYPLGLSGFPYVDYHRSFPYSVFLGPEGAQASLPQVYWKAIGTTVDQAFAHTYLWNDLYQRPIFPLGQLYSDPPPADIRRFRQLADAHGATGTSWWSWQSASARGWAAIGSAVAPLAGPPAPPAYPALEKGARGDVVLWAQEHLIAAGQSVTPDGVYSAAMEQAVRSFQTANVLPVTGRLDASAWPALLRYQPTVPDWSGVAQASAFRATGRSGPRSALLRARRDELHGTAAGPPAERRSHRPAARRR
jgi:putative peptidoglycan binding protein